MYSPQLGNVRRRDPAEEINNPFVLSSYTESIQKEVLKTKNRIPGIDRSQT